MLECSTELPSGPLRIRSRRRHRQLNRGVGPVESAGEMSIHERIRIRIDPDGLSAWVAIAAGPALSGEALRESLAEAGVVAGIDEAVARVASSTLGIETAALEPYRIARGQPASDPTPDVVELRDAIGPLPGRLREDESFDYRERGGIVPVNAGDELGRIVPGRPGTPGYTVCGAEIAASPPAAAALVYGDGIVRDEQGILRAARTGARSVKKDGSLDVVALHVHPAAVDLRSGNLSTEGSLRISGDVAEAMIARAGVDLEIKGTVDAARIEAGGSIEIRGGVIGAGTGRVRARGNLKVGHAVKAQLIAGGTLSVLRSVLASDLSAREIEIAGPMLGDRAQAETRIRVRDVGSPAGGACTLRVAHPLDAFDAERDGAGDARERARAELRGSTERLSARKSRETGKRRGERPAIETAPQLAEKRSFRQREHELQREARIEIQGTAHPGCRIDFGGKPLVLEEAVRARVYRFDTERGEIVVEGS